MAFDEMMKMIMMIGESEWKRNWEESKGKILVPISTNLLSRLGN